MAETSISTGNALAVKQYSVALFAQTLRSPNLAKNLTGPAPKITSATRKLKHQTSAGYPVVRVHDLTSTAGDKVSVDCVDIIGGNPIMGDQDAEGQGEPLTFSSQDVSIDNYTKVVDAGGKMSQKRTKHALRKLALANLSGYFPRLNTQLCLVHLAGDRGDQTGQSWHVPLDTHADFGSIMINPVKAPTFNRHFVVNATGAGITQGGQAVTAVTANSTLKLSHLDDLVEYLDDLEFKMQPIRIADDPAAQDEPMLCLLLGPRAYKTLLTDATANNNIRSFQQNAWNRASYGSKHPLFRGDVGLWNGILVKKIDYSIRWLLTNPGPNDFKYCAAGTETESSATIATLSGKGLERGLLLGAQALADVYGNTGSVDGSMSWLERWKNFRRHLEIAAESMYGKAKLRFSPYDETGAKIPTDHGVLAIDSVVTM